MVSRGPASSPPVRTSTASTRRTPPTPSSRAMPRRPGASPSATSSQGASSLKIYFRLPLASAHAVIDVCEAHHVPCTAHLEILDARELLLRGCTASSTSPRSGRACCRASSAKRTGRRCSPTTTHGATGGTRCFAHLQLDGPDAQALYAVLRARHPLIDPTLAVFEQRAAAPPVERRRREKAAMMAAGFENMKQLTRRAALEGARVVVGGHSTVPFAARGEAPWREMELLVESGFTPLEVIQAATGTAAGVSVSERRTRHAASGPDSRSGRPRRGSAEGHPRRPQRRARADGGRLAQRDAVQGLLRLAGSSRILAARGDAEGTRKVSA